MKKRGQKKKALLIIDMLNTLDFPEGTKLLKYAIPAAKNIARLKERCETKKIPVIYVNDNFGHWRSDWKQVFAICADEKSRGAELAHRLEPNDKNYFILKPKHSGFYSTNLEELLDTLNIGELIMTGVAGNICVLFTAHDAHMREYKVVVPKDCVASNTKEENDFALNQLKTVFGIHVEKSTSLRI